MHNFNALKLVLILIVTLSKGQQQVSAQKQQHQQQFAELFTVSNKPKPQGNVQIQKQQIQQQDSVQSSGEQTYRPITFPSGEEPLTNDRIQPLPAFSNNSVAQAVDQKTTTRNSPQELTRPTRVVMAATVANVENRYTDDQLDYIRDFSWNMFQVNILMLEDSYIMLMKFINCLGLKAAINHRKSCAVTNSTTASAIVVTNSCIRSY